MKKYIIYTDASSKPGRSVEVGIIVKSHHIIDIYYKKYYVPTANSIRAENRAVINSICFLKEKYKTDNCYIYTDCLSLIKKHPKYCKFVRSHKNNRTNWKYRFNCLADYITRNGLENWRTYWETKLLM